jgi:very-short-patch-repair endonuclease
LLNPSAKSITLSMAAIEREVARLAGRQRGYVTRGQLLAIGVTRHQIVYRVASGRLIPVHAGVYAVGHLPTLAQDRARAALLACGSAAVLSHRSAGSLWGIFKDWRMPFEVTAPTVRRPRGVTVHRAALERPDIRTHAGLRVTSPARTLLDIAPRLAERVLRRAVNDLRRQRHLHPQQLEDVVRRFPRAPGARRLRRFVEAPRDNPTRSDLEDRFLAFVERFGLPRPEINARVAGREVDAWFAQERVIVELDGWEFHGDRDSFEDDRDKDATALALDIPTVRLTDWRMERAPEREAERLWAILRARRAA